MMIRLITCGALLTTILAGWASCQDVPEKLTDAEKQEALREINGSRQYGVYRTGCRSTNVQVGTFKKLSEAVAEAQKNKSPDVFVLVGDQKRIGDYAISDKVKIYMVGASLRCGSPYVAARYATVNAARAAAEKHPYDVLVVDVGGSSQVDTNLR